MKFKEQRIETPDGTLVIRRNRKGEILWRVIGKENNEKVSGSTEGYETMRTTNRSMEITRLVLNAAAGKP